jgi:hypothetical protein
MAWTNPTTVSAGSVLTASKWNDEVKGNLDDVYAARRLAYVDRGASGASNYTVSSSTFGGAAEVFSSDISFTANGTSTYWVVFYCPLVIVGSTASSSVTLSLSDGGSNEIARIGLFGVAGLGVPALIRAPYTPSSGSKSLNLRAWNQVSNGTLTFGSPYVAGFLAVYGPDLT